MGLKVRACEKEARRFLPVMKLKTRTNKIFHLTLSRKELDAIALSVALMLQNEHTHPAWIKKLDPIYNSMAEALNLDPNYKV